MNRQTILKHHDKCTTFVFSIDSIDEEELAFLHRANSMVLAHMNVKNINCLTPKKNSLEFSIGGDCGEYEEVLQQNISFGLKFLGIPNDYLGMVIDVS
jgi:hypothetical protein